MTANSADRRCRGGGRTDMLEGAVDPSRDNLSVSRTLLERAAGAGESPVGDGGWGRVDVLREYRRTRGIRREAGRTTAQG